MTRREKKIKAAMIAIAYCLENDENCSANKNQSQWTSMGKEVLMNNRTMVQRRGRSLK